MSAAERRAPRLRAARSLAGRRWSLVAVALLLRLSALRHRACRTSTTPTRTRTSCRARSGCSGTRSTRTTSSTRRPSRTCCTSLFALRWGVDPASVGGGVRGRPDDGVRDRPRGVRAARRARRRAADRDRRARGCSTTGASGCSPARCWPSRSCRCTTRTSRSTTRRRSRRCACALVGVAGIYRTRPHARLRARRASALGVACATKYTAGIVRADASSRRRSRRRSRHARRRAAWCSPARCSCVALPGRQPVRAARPPRVPRRAAASSPRPRGDGGGKLGLANTQRLVATTSARSPGASAGCRRWPRSAGAVGAARCATGGWRSCSLPAPILLFLYLGHPGPLLRPLAAADLPDALPAGGVGAVASRPGCARLPLRASRWSRALGASLLLPAGPRVQRPQRPRAGPRRHAHARPRLDGRRTSRSGTKIVVEPIAPDQWATDAGHRCSTTAAGPAPATAGTSGATSRSCFFNGKLRKSRRRARWSSSRTTSARTRPALIGSYARGGYCWVVTGSTQYGRAYADPQEVPDALALLRRAQAARPTWSSSVAPTASAKRVPFSFDYSFNYYPLATTGPGRRSSSTSCPACDTASDEARRRHRRRLLDRRARRSRT